MKAAVSIILLVLSVAVYRILTNPSLATFAYIVVSHWKGFDSDAVVDGNYDGEVEDDVFIHRFVHLNETYHGLKVNVTYHAVECGDPHAEPIVFAHGLCENWRVWKETMKNFCGTHRAIAYDIEGMGQSHWPDVLGDLPLPKGSSMDFMADMQMGMLHKLGVSCFNLIVTDYSFWSTLGILDYKQKDSNESVILRYGKFQSTAGVEDASRVPQGKLMKLFPRLMDFIVNLNSHALSRVLFGKTLINGWKDVESNNRNYQPISDETYRDIISPGLRKGGLTAWVYFYNYGKDICSQMEFQRRVLGEAKFPVYILQGAKDLGQPMYLFDGTMSMEIVEKPSSTLKEKLLRFNHTHVTVNTYSPDGKTKVGPTAPEFFYSSPWVKYEVLEEVGHFLHLEAPEQVLKAVKELVDVPIQQDTRSCSNFKRNAK